MLRALNLILPFAEARMTRRRHRRFAPSLAGASSCLEDRVVLSATGPLATAAAIQGPASPGTPGNGAVGPVLAPPPNDPPGAPNA
jgi:hypothetical protein